MNSFLIHSLILHLLRPYHQNHYNAMGFMFDMWIQKAPWRQDTSCNLWIRFASWLPRVMPFRKGELSSSCPLSEHVLYVPFCFPYKHTPEINIHWHLHDMKSGRQSQLFWVFHLYAQVNSVCVRVCVLTIGSPDIEIWLHVDPTWQAHLKTVTLVYI